MNGKLIVFEGVEGAGKTTQIERTYQWLQTQLPKETPLMVTREPGGTNLGQQLRQILLGTGQNQLPGDIVLEPSERTELLLYAADRAQHVEEVLQPNLQKGVIILCDRYTDSTIAYQGYGRGIDLNLISQLNQIATGGLKSDLTLWLDVAVEQGLTRAKKRGTIDRMEQADLDFHYRVQKGFQQLATTYPQPMVRVDANLPEEEVWLQIQVILCSRLAQLLGKKL